MKLFNRKAKDSEELQDQEYDASDEDDSEVEDDTEEYSDEEDSDSGDEEFDEEGSDSDDEFDEEDSRKTLTVTTSTPTRMKRTPTGMILMNMLPTKTLVMRPQRTMKGRRTNSLASLSPSRTRFITC